MTYAKNFAGQSGQYYYAKPAPLTVTPWADDAIVAAETGSTGTFTLTGLIPGQSYFIYERVGVSPASTDDLECVWSGSLSAIQVKTDSLGTGTVSINAPVTATGSIKEIIIGDDYLAENGRAFEWLIDPIAGFDINDCVCFFGGETADGSKWLIVGSMSTVSGKWKLSFNFPNTETARLVRGQGEWSVAVHSGLIEITRIRNKDGHKVAIVDKYTN